MKLLHVSYSIDQLKPKPKKFFLIYEICDLRDVQFLKLSKAVNLILFPVKCNNVDRTWGLKNVKSEFSCSLPVTFLVTSLSPC